MPTAGLRCEVSMGKDDIQEWMSRITPYCVLEADVVGYTDGGVTLLSNLQIIEDGDPDLTAIREELLVPVIIHTSLGSLMLDRRLGHYEGGAEWCGVPIRLSVSCSDETDLAAAVSVAESLFRAQELWIRRVNEFAADQLLQLKNESWLGNDEDELSREDFISRMALEEISVDESGDFSFWHDDGGLFWGHAILIRGNVAAGLLEADIPG